MECISPFSEQLAAAELASAVSALRAVTTVSVECDAAPSYSSAGAVEKASYAKTAAPVAAVASWPFATISMNSLLRCKKRSPAAAVLSTADLVALRDLMIDPAIDEMRASRSALQILASLNRLEMQAKRSKMSIGEKRLKRKELIVEAGTRELIDAVRAVCTTRASGGDSSAAANPDELLRAIAQCGVCNGTDLLLASPAPSVSERTPRLALVDPLVGAVDDALLAEVRAAVWDQRVATQDFSCDDETAREVEERYAALGGAAAEVSSSGGGSGTTAAAAATSAPPAPRPAVLFSAPHTIFLRRDGHRDHLKESTTRLVATECARYAAGSCLTWSAMQTTIWANSGMSDRANRDPNYLHRSELGGDPFHSAIRAFCGAARARGSAVVHFDIHGRRDYSAAIGNDQSDCDVGTGAVRQLHGAEVAERVAEAVGAALRLAFDGVTFVAPRRKKGAKGRVAKKVPPIANAAAPVPLRPLAVHTSPQLQGAKPVESGYLTMTQQSLVCGAGVSVQLELSARLRNRLRKDRALLQKVAHALWLAANEIAPVAHEELLVEEETQKPKM